MEKQLDIYGNEIKISDGIKDKLSDLILADTREKNNKHILQYFKDHGQPCITTKVEAGDYIIYNDYSIVIDKKDHLLELCGNLANAKEHARVKREIERARELGCERFIFLIQHPTIRFVDEVYTWKVPKNGRTGMPYTKVKPETLQKIMMTFEKKYGVEFMFCKRSDSGKMIMSLLNM
jgi:hypothetical protein